ncbi:MerR family DNA-binding transcriptional regulator [Nocardioides sp.]|uniref:MerR family transcriptional regulator n=1 Tax=Nocardioides sp. TaxID=35761 RepID=UPI002735B28A|nr:MerR family DNA-binding transcriptional regulator [Nocardioides sp.]MDP3894572.1 MerR family DNA-binding transcriptional regulator [Nocardioides sp.]
METWTISELAEEYDVTLRTLRHYEDLRLLAPERRGTTRIYHVRDRIRLELILRGKRLGFSLDQIAVIVNMYDGYPGEEGQLEYLLTQIDVRRSELARLREDIAQTERELGDVEARCRQDLRRIRVAGSAHRDPISHGDATRAPRDQPDPEPDGSVPLPVE